MGACRSNLGSSTKSAPGSGPRAFSAVISDVLHSYCRAGAPNDSVSLTVGCRERQVPPRVRAASWRAAGRSGGRMRIKIIAVNALIVAIMGLLSFLLVRSALGLATSNKDQLTTEAQNDVNGAAARLQLDGLRAERWLAAAASEPATADALSKGTSVARSEAATKRCDDLVSKMKNVQLFERNVPTLVALVDTSGRILGRNNSNLGRGDDMASVYAGLKSTLSTGQSGSDVWYERDQYLASYVVVYDEQGKIIGGLVIGRPLNDSLSRVSEATTGRPLVVVVTKGGSFEVVAHSAQSSPALDESIGKGAKEMLGSALSHQQTDVVRDGDSLVAAAPLPA